MKVERCPVEGPHGWCQHEDGDGYWPAAWVDTACLPESALRMAERVAPRLSLPDGWVWDSDTAFVHIGPVTGMRQGFPVCALVVSRAVRKAADQPAG